MERATIEKVQEYAALDFPARQHEPDEWRPPTNTEWADLANPHLVTIRVAWLLHFKSKAEVMQVVRDLDEEAGSELMEHMTDTIEFVRNLLSILEGAEARILCAGASVEIEDGGNE